MTPPRVPIVGENLQSADHNLGQIEQLITALVRTAPAAGPGVIDELVERLHHVGSPLARSIARVVELIGEQLVAPGIALPPLAMACATLADGVRGKLSDRELEAARYEIETLLPVPDRPPAIDPTGALPPPRRQSLRDPHPRDLASPVAAPDVPLSALRKRGR